MKVILRFLELGAAIALSLFITVIIIDQTALNADTVLGAANSSGVYDQLAQSIPSLTTGLPKDQIADLKVILTAFATPDYVKAQVTRIVDEVEASIHNGDPLPAISFGDLAQTAIAQGYTVPYAEEQWLQTPIQLNKSPEIAGVVRGGRALTTLEWRAGIVALILLALIIVVAGRRRYGALAKTLILTIVGIGVWLGVWYLVISFSVSTLKASGQLAALGAPIGKIASILEADIVHTALWPIGALAAAAVVLVIMQLVRGRKKHVDADKTPTPIVGSMRDRPMDPSR